MNPPQVYMCSPSWTLLSPPSPFHPSGSSQCTSPKHPVSCIEPGLATHFIHDILHVSMPFSQIFLFGFSSVQSLSDVQLSTTPWTAAHKFSMLHCPSPTPGAYSTHVHQVSDAIHPSHPLLSLSPPHFNHSQHQGLFQWVSSSHQVAKVLEFQLQHQSFQWIFRTDFLQDRVVGSHCCPRESQESYPTPQFKSINSSALSFLYPPALICITTGKAIAVPRQTIVGKVMSLLFNMLSSLTVTFLPRSKHLLISYLQSPSAVILEPPPN